MLSVYVITLARRADRRAWIAEQIPRNVSVTYTTDAGLACDGMALTREQIDALPIFPWQLAPSECTKAWDLTPLSVGDIACAISHLNCWRHALESGADRVLILEDDAVLRKTFWTDLDTILEEIKDEPWHLLYLGRYALEGNRGKISERVVVPGYSHKTHAYVVTREGLERLTAARLDEAFVHIDEFLPAMYIDHPREDMRARFPKRLRALAVEPPLAVQLHTRFGVSDTRLSRPIPVPSASRSTARPNTIVSRRDKASDSRKRKRPSSKQ